MNWFVFAFLIVWASYAVAGKKVMTCYYGTWATYRAGLGKFAVENVNTDLCSHVIYSFTGINTVGTLVSLDPFLDLDYGHGNFRKFTKLKKINPNLKTMLAVGGWNEGSWKYSIMAANPTYRQNFIRSALATIQEYNFDGLDLDWEYPNSRDTAHGRADVNNFSLLIKELKTEFVKHDLLLTAAVYANKKNAELYYDVPAISEYLDFVHLMTYDMHGAWDAVTGHNAPLHKGEGDTANREELFSVDVAVEYWLRAGCPPEKLVLGLPLYGRTFTLTTPNVNGVKASSSGAGISGPYTFERGFMGYNEICDKIQTEKWDVRYDSLAKVPYAFQGTNWISFDDAESLTKKVEFANSLNLAGAMVWSIETEDFHGICGDGVFPLLKAINKALERDGLATTEKIEESKTTTEEISVIEDITTTESNTATEMKPATDSTTIESNPTTEENSSGESSTEANPVTEDSITEANPGTEDNMTEVPALIICKEEGFNADPESCSFFYVCMTDGNGGLLPRKFECPPMTYWDQVNHICNFKNLVKCNLH